MRSCLAETTLKLLTVLGVVVTINKVVFPGINKATYTYEENLEKKLLVLICFSSKGISSPYYVPSGQTIYQEVYLKNCIKIRHIPFIN